MSDTKRHLSYRDAVLAGRSLTSKKFPPAWLIHYEDKYVIERAHWNMEPPPSDEIFDSVQWNTFQGRYLLLPQATLGGALLAGLILRLYFGITGCIVPIIYVEAFEPNVITFTLAGPYDADGKKEMYLLAHTGEVDEVKLYRYSCGYSSIAEFYARPKVHLIPIAPVHGGKKALMAEYKKIGLPWY